MTGLPNIPATIAQHRADHYEQWPTRSNRASFLDHPCERFLTYKRTRWKEEARPSPDLLSIFEEGKIHEEAVISLMRAAGYRVILQQQAFQYDEHPEYEITGHIDGSIVVNSSTFPFDVKSCSPYTWRELEEHNAESVRNHKHYYVRGCYGQMVLYLLMGNKELGVLLFKDKTTGLLKQIEIPLDYAYAEELLQKAGRINAHMRANTLPDRIPYSQEICGRCSFFHICLPDEALRAGATLTDDPELEDKLRRRAELEQAAREFGRLDEEIKKQSREQLGENGEAIVGVDWIVRTSTWARKGYSVEPGLITSVKIERLGRSGTADA